MNVSLYQAAAALDANSRWQEMIAENLAASSIPGFKKQELTFAAHEAGLLPPTSNPASGTAPRHFALPTATASTSFAPGETKHTGVATDLAIEGPAFFSVQLPSGATAYTRDGEFHLDAQGQMVTKEGYLLLSDSGPIQMDPRNPAPLSISPDGTVSQGEDEKGRLALMEFADPQRLSQILGGYFVAEDPRLTPSPAENSSLRQGYIEGANTSPVNEMANLMTALRHFEANQKIVQATDDRMRQTIQELGNPN